MKQAPTGSGASGNAGLSVASGPPPAWRGFRPLRVSRKTRESGNVTSLGLESQDGQPLAPALPGQFIVLRLGPTSAPVLMRSYSLSGEPRAPYYRISVKREAHGAAGAYIDDELQVGDTVTNKRATRQFHVTAGRHTRYFAERRDRRDPGARHASRAGGRSVAAGNLVAIRNP